MNVFITGITGFVGSHLAARLESHGLYQVAGTCRNKRRATDSILALGEISEVLDWRSALENQDVVIHAAARVHVMDDQAADPLQEFRRVNTYGTLALAKQAAEVGVKRFIFISSIKVNGEGSDLDTRYTAQDTPAPKDHYGQSKAEAEVGLKELSADTGMEVIIIRPPLIYGPGVKANFLKLLSWVEKGIPLPLGSVTNKRSMVGLDNLVDLIVTCINSPATLNQTFLVSDDDDVSTPELIRRMATVLERKARLIPIPEFCLQAVGGITGKRDTIGRLCGSLQVDIRHTKETLSWHPPHTMQDQLKKTVEAFRKENGLVK